MADDFSAATPPVWAKERVQDYEFIAKTIRFQFSPSDYRRIGAIQPAVVHHMWLNAILSEYGDDVHIINNYNCRVTMLDMHKLEDPTAYDKQFKVHSKNTPGQPDKQSVIIIHRILTRIPFGQLKRFHRAFEIILKNKCFLTEHYWDESEWDVSQLGFITGYNPQCYEREQAAAMFCKRLQQDAPRMKVPKFKFILSSPRASHQGRTVTTKAYALDVPTHLTHTMIKILKDTTSDTKEFASYRLRRRHPEAFQGAICYQNHVLSNQHMVVINNVGMDAMFYLSKRIKAIGGFQDAVPSRNVTINRRYNILVEKSSFANVRKELLKNFSSWYATEVPMDARPSDGKYPGPPGVAPPRQDGYLSGEQSYMTTSSYSFMQ